MVEELPKLHHHVGVPRVRKVLSWAGSHILTFNHSYGMPPPPIQY